VVPPNEDALADMSHKLAGLLDQPEVAVSSAVGKLEKLSSFSGCDIKLLSRMNNQARSKIESLGLDAEDTLGSELYHALKIRFERDEKLLLQSLGLSEKTMSPEKFAQQVVSFVNHLDMPKNVWALKKSTAKNLLKKQPPKRLMKQLNYRSIDSLLKRENISAIFGAVEATESGRWQKEFWRSFSELNASDFENREVEIVVTKEERWKTVNQNLSISTVLALGAVIVWPNTSINRLGAIGLSVLLAHQINNVRITGTYIKLHQIDLNFGNILAQICKEGLDIPLKVSYLPIQWKTILHHYGKSSQTDFQEAFEPHISQNDVALHEELAALAKINPVFRWWAGHEHVAANLKGEHISLNIMDILTSFIANLPYEKRSISHFRQSLWHKLIDSYLEHEPVKKFVMAEAGIMEPSYEAETTPNINKFLASKDYARAF
jgi:hypothetical protein